MITQLSAFNICLSSFDVAVDAISHAGFYHLSVYFSPHQFIKALHELDEWEVEEIVHKAELYGLRIVATGGPCNVLTADGVTELQQAIRVAADLDADVFDTASLSFQGKDADQIARETRRFCDNMQRAADIAGEVGVVICLETHGGMTGTVERCLQTMAQINHPNVGIGFDPANIIYYEGADPLADLDELLPFIGHVHAKDCVTTDGRTGFVTVGTGELPWRRVLTQLDEGGFGGYVTVERLSGDTDAQRARELSAAYDFLTRFPE